MYAVPFDPYVIHTPATVEEARTEALDTLRQMLPTADAENGPSDQDIPADDVLALYTAWVNRVTEAATIADVLQVMEDWSYDTHDFSSDYPRNV